MPYGITTKLTTYRVTVPPWLNQAVSPIYLGMPPLPIGTQKPLTAVGEKLTKAEVKPNVASNFSGVSVRSGGLVGKKEKSKVTRKYNNGSGQSFFGSKKSTTQRKTRNNSKTKTKKKVLLRAANGKFLKRGK